jgi:hypothetical protein
VGRPSILARRFERRRFLRGAGVVGLGTLAPLSAMRPASASTTAKIRVFRLSTRGQRVCDACKGHAANKYFRLRRSANHRRAHLGCNCQIVKQRIDQHLWATYFVRRDQTLRNVWDMRWA